MAGNRTSKICFFIVSMFLTVSLVVNVFLYEQQSEEKTENSELLDLQNQLTSLENTHQNYVDTHSYSNSDYVFLQNQLNSLETSHQNYISQNSHSDSEYSALQSQIDDLESQITDLQNQVTDFQNQLNQKTQDYIELQQDYNDLLSDYNLINGPVSTFDTVEDLQVELTTDRTVYSYTDALTGTVSITYLNGTAFVGTFDIGINPEFGSYGGVNIPYGRLNVTENGEFTVEPPYSFKYGPGNYSVYMVRIENLDGYTVASGHELSDNIRVYVEAR